MKLASCTRWEDRGDDGTFSNDGQPRRREYSKPFKAQVSAQCGQPGASVGGVALADGMHSNMVHRWIREAQRDQAFTLSQGVPAAFVALPVPAPVSAAGD
jgi:transposase